MSVVLTECNNNLPFVLTDRIATAVIGIAFILSLSSNLAIELASSIVSLLAAFLTLLAFIIDIALYAHTKHEMHAIDQSKTVTAPGTFFFAVYRKQHAR